MSRIEPSIGLKQNWGVEEIFLAKESMCPYADIGRGSSEATEHGWVTQSVLIYSKCDKYQL